MELIFIVTDAGRAALVNLPNTGTDAVQIASAGLSETATVPDASLTALPDQLKTVSTLAGSAVDDDTIHILLRDESSAAYSLHSVGLYLDDGTLFAVYGQADPIVEKTAASLMLMEINIQFADIDADSITFGDANFMNPPATETMQGIAELATQAESDAGTDDARIVTPKKLKASVNTWFADVWRASNDGSGSGLDADVLRGLHWTSGQDVTFGMVDGKTPGNGSTGGLRVRANAANTQATLQVTNTAASGEWGYWRFSPDGTANWNGSGGASLYCASNKVWDAGNDGAGSGLDADLLDGQQGSYYTNITARLGYTPLNATAYTAADVLSKLLTVDGSGSGLDADLLDGSGWTSGQDVAFGMTTAQTPNTGSTGGLRLRGNATSGNAILQVTNHNSTEQWGYFIVTTAGNFNWMGAGNASMLCAGNKVWDAGNDGAGSGMDADLLDGMHESAFGRKPQTATGIGHWTAIDINLGTGSIRTPAGGTWAFFYTNAGGAGIGVAAGGTLLFQGSLNNVGGFAWRIA